MRATHERRLVSHCQTCYIVRWWRLVEKLHNTSSLVCTSNYICHLIHYTLHMSSSTTSINIIFLLNKQDHDHYQTWYTYDEEDFRNIVSLKLHMYLVFLQIQKTLHMSVKKTVNWIFSLIKKTLILFIVKKVKERTTRLAVCVIFVSRGLDRYLTASCSRVTTRNK